MKKILSFPSVIARNPLLAIALSALGCVLLRRAWKRLAKHRLKLENDFIPVNQRGKEQRSKQPKEGRIVELSGVERGIIGYSQNMHGAYKVGLLLKLQGPQVNDSALRSALRKLQARHPLLRMVLVERNGQLYLEEKPKREIEVIHVPFKSQDSAKEAWEEYSREPATVDQTLLKIILLETKLKPGNFATELVLVMDHAWCDGLSITNLCKEILLVLAGESDFCDEKLPLQAPVEYLTIQTYGSGLVNWYRRIKDLVSFVVKLIGEGEAVKFPFGLPDLLPASEMKECKTVTYTRVIPVKKLLEACKKHNITIGAAVAAATCKSTAHAFVGSDRKDVVKVGRIAINLAADMRRRLKPTIDRQHLGFYVAAIESFWADLAEVQKGGLESADNLWYWGERMQNHYTSEEAQNASYQLCQLLEMGLTRAPSHDGLATVAITNWGKMSLDTSYGEWKINAVEGQFNPLHFLMPTMLLSTFNNELRLHMCVSEPAASGKAADSIMDNIVRSLDLMVEA